MQIKAIELHNFDPGRNKIPHKAFLAIVLGVDLGNGAQLTI